MCYTVTAVLYFYAVKYPATTISVEASLTNLATAIILSFRMENTMRIAVCDDNEACRLQALQAIEGTTKSLDVLVDTYANGTVLLDRFKTIPYDIIFLDIEMPEIDGIHLAKAIRAISPDVYIVFLTSHIEYALEGYEVNALRYLTKPINPQKLLEVLNYVTQQLQQDNSLWVKTDMGEERLNISDILYLEAQNQNVAIITANKTYFVRYNIRDYENELASEGFLRIHRGYLISLKKITGISKNEVILEGNHHLPVSRSKEKSLKEAFYKYIKEVAI